MSDLPRPIPWLGAIGPVGPLEVRSEAVPPEAAPPVDPARGSARRSVLAGWFRRRFAAPRRPGSGLPVRRSIRVLRWVRRGSQALFLGLFLFLLLRTGFAGGFAGGATVRLPEPVEAFLRADPFVALLTLLSTHRVYAALAWALVVVALTLVFGRAFCGWICPFGTLHHFVSWLMPDPHGATSGSRRVRANTTHGYQHAKYYLLAAFLVAAACGSAIGGLFDPICISVRGIGLGVLPAFSYVLGHGLDQVSSTNVLPLQAGADHARDAMVVVLRQPRQVYFHQAWLIGGLLFAVLLANRWIPRFWCRVLCPLGATLGLVARYALFGLEKRHERCTDCHQCLVHCQGADSPQGGVKWHQDECHLCLNCEAGCPESVLRFRWLPDRGSTAASLALDRRKVLVGALSGAVVLPALRTSDTLDVNYHERLIRPPGSLPERPFLERCIRCAECMKVCPNNALHPALLEGGVEGLWTPVLIPRIGYCEPSCVLCGQVCPTGAIRKITEAEKLGDPARQRPPIRLGTAFYDHGRCLPWAMATPCIVCEEFCPTSPKSIWVEEVEAPDRTGRLVRLQRPHVDPRRCIGCGACEKVCPVQDRPAVYVTSVGESRSRTNVILLDEHR